ncbi:uncharacterized protein LOC115388680 isoform X1 [Salarias fasciatus]|uniref:uncharacterized protein LOC115388680 isoform X1 n=1 Tax=Salarias fasciatus TaxID=181472 RepID=UPI001176B2FC|nr:uncharacterized protein LOC115388680 isoform X1 [Salarias fasciatus]
MKMKMKVVAVAVVVSALLVTDVQSTRPTEWTPTGQPGLDLTGKMFTFSQNGGGVRFYPGSQTPPWATTSRPWTSTYHPWAPTTRPWATTTRPWATTTRPWAPTTRPWATTTRPWATTTRPWATTTRPWAPTTRPWATTSRPWTSTYHPWAPTTRPWATTTRPWATTTRPWAPTTRPWATTTRPWATTTRPWAPTTRPWATTTRPWAPTTRPWAPTTRPWATTTRPWATTTRPWGPTTYPQTTETPVRGVSVCVRYMADSSDFVNLFTLDKYKYSRSLKLTQNRGSVYTLNNYYFEMTMTTKFQLWPNYQQNMWTSVCLTLDGSNNVAQLFRDSSMSVRMVMPSRLEWSGDPLIEFPGFSGQMTDLQVWDYPLGYKEIYNYMRRGAFRPSRGSLLTWSNINFSNGGNSLLEDEYDVLAQQPMRGGGGGEKRGGRGGRLRKRKFSAEESQEMKGRLMI